MIQKERIGIIITAKNLKTVNVLVHRKYIHPIYKKICTLSRCFQVHDENNQCRVGDIILMKETAPISRTKKWTISKILNKLD